MQESPHRCSSHWHGSSRCSVIWVYASVLLRPSDCLIFVLILPRCFPHVILLVAVPRGRVDGKGGFVHFPSFCNMAAFERYPGVKAPLFRCRCSQLSVVYPENGENKFARGGGSATEMCPCFFCHFFILCSQPR